MIAPVDAVAAEWVKLTTPRFTVISQVSESRTRAWAADFERFRRGLNQLLPAPPERLEPLRVVLFRSDRLFRPFKPLAAGKPADVGGVFFLQPGRSLAAVAVDGARSDTRERIFHEATHWHLAAFDRDLPLWLNEGLAEVFSNFELRGDNFLVGTIRQGDLKYVHTFGPLPFVRLAAIRDGSLDYDWQHIGETELVYAQSWTTVHFLLFERPNGLPNMLRFLRNTSVDADALEEVRRCFGLSPAELDREVAAYAMRRRVNAFSAPLDRRDVGKDFVLQPAEKGDVDLALGELLLGSERYADAAPYLARAAAALPDDPAPQACLGEVALASKHAQEAYEHFARSLELGGDSFIAYYFTAMSEWGEWMERGAAGPESRKTLDHIVRNLVNSLQMNRRFSGGYEGAGLVLASAADPAVVRQLEPWVREGERRYPSSPGVQIGLGYLALRDGDLDRARVCAGRARAARTNDPALVTLLCQRLAEVLAQMAKNSPTK